MEMEKLTTGIEGSKGETEAREDGDRCRWKTNKDTPVQRPKCKYVFCVLRKL